MFCYLNDIPQHVFLENTVVSVHRCIRTQVGQSRDSSLTLDLHASPASVADAAAEDQHDEQEDDA